MRKTIATASLLLLAGLLIACGGSNDGNDAGTDAADGSSGLTPCTSDSDCTSPETCQDDGTCRYVPGPKPDVNRLNGVFNLYLNANDGECLVTGKIDGKSVYMEWGWAEHEPPQTPTIDVYLYGILTNDLYRVLLIRVAADSPLDTEIGLGQDGPGEGSVDLLVLDSSGRVLSQTPEAEIIGGNVVFSRFGAVDNSQIKGTFTAEMLPAEGL